MRKEPRGFSLLEIAVASAAGLFLVATSIPLVQSAFGGMRENERASRLEERAARLADRLDREFRTAGLSTLRVPGPLGPEPITPGEEYVDLTYRRLLGFTTAVAVYGPEVRIYRQGTRILRESAGFPTEALAVDATDFRGVLNGRTLRLTMEVERAGGGATLRQQVVRTVTLPNP